jgi:ABC-2 type transport system permease protein
MLPQFFLAGVFNPIQNLPLPLEILSRLSPMRYAVDIVRNVFFADQRIAVEDLTTNVAIIAAEFIAFMVIGTAGFVRSERNR